MTFLGLFVSKRDITGNLILQLGSNYSYDPISSKSQARDLPPPEFHPYPSEPGDPPGHSARQITPAPFSEENGTHMFGFCSG